MTKSGATYQTQWSRQGIFTIQKYTDLVLQFTPIDPNPAFTGFNIDINADGKTGTANTFNPANPTSICFNDSPDFVINS